MSKSPDEDLFRRAFFDLEEPIRDAMHMASIAASLAHDLLDARGEPDGDAELVRMSPQDRDRLLFAIGMARDLAQKANAAFLDAPAV